MLPATLSPLPTTLINYESKLLYFKRKFFFLRKKKKTSFPPQTNTMSVLRSRILVRNFSNTGYRKPFPTRTAPVRSGWDHVYGLSSVLSALQSKKRSVLDSLYILESDEKKTTQKKDATLMDKILQLSKEANIYTVAMDKGELNNLTDNKTHQVKERKKKIKINFFL